MARLQVVRRSNECDFDILLGTVTHDGQGKKRAAKEDDYEESIKKLLSPRERSRLEPAYNAWWRQAISDGTRLPNNMSYETFVEQVIPCLFYDVGFRWCFHATEELDTLVVGEKVAGAAVGSSPHFVIPGGKSMEVHVLDSGTHMPITLMLGKQSSMDNAMVWIVMTSRGRDIMRAPHHLLHDVSTASLSPGQIAHRVQRTLQDMRSPRVESTVLAFLVYLVTHHDKLTFDDWHTRLPQYVHVQSTREAMFTTHSPSSSSSSCEENRN